MRSGAGAKGLISRSPSLSPLLFQFNICLASQQMRNYLVQLCRCCFIYLLCFAFWVRKKTKNIQEQNMIWGAERACPHLRAEHLWSLSFCPSPPLPSENKQWKASYWEGSARALLPECPNCDPGGAYSQVTRYRSAASGTEPGTSRCVL